MSFATVIVFAIALTAFGLGGICCLYTLTLEANKFERNCCKGNYEKRQCEFKR